MAWSFFLPKYQFFDGLHIFQLKLIQLLKILTMVEINLREQNNILTMYLDFRLYGNFDIDWKDVEWRYTVCVNKVQTLLNKNKCVIFSYFKRDVCFYSQNVLLTNVLGNLKLNYFKKQQKLVLTFPYLTGSNWPRVLNRLVPCI